MKQWYFSKTVWLNIIATVLLVLPMIDQKFLTDIGVVDTQKYLSIVASITATLNLILRVTSTRIISTAKRIKNSNSNIKK